MDVGDQQSRELVFAALADQVRREILDTLASHGECSAGFISEHISSVGRTTVSAHLKALKMSGVVVERRAGRHRYFSVDPAGPANDALRFLRDVLERSLVAAQTSSSSPSAGDAEDDASETRSRRRA
ncbi:transcriptional regulator [Rhodococcus sp. 06-470-2]|uniref:ArsR/SmtB family transcription factor n=1 Tax=unclassified Rhodococcus (in: high G+C Gram-positive bacteria) TaxID=192944 RepID=UPI000B9B7E70|nr:MULTISPECIES: winged helix-turn-helix domain-containing protein [unclassified Rhodococcus (in: high G+C Gram-positive bacteria)]OZC59837.1 transcriptional regulator [Rhodococcus sp. 06-470-2]OZE61113.1 transcriptional regulator [Rhodococcus sp. 05-2221-1B]OZF31268.1 transcriptional regulator [Rhodococcus sp. 14-2496-1d]